MKNLLKFALFLGFLPAIMLASSGGSGDYDIVPRTINFLIFAAILIYLLKNPAKNFYNARINKISSRLEDIQKRVLESKNKKLEMAKKIEDAKKEGAAAVELAQKEAQILAEKIAKDTKAELALMQRYFEEQKDYERRKMQKEVVAALLGELFESKDAQLSQDAVLDIMLKKVS